MRTKRQGLGECYDVQAGHEYFEVHETVDVAHSESERRMIEAHAGGHEAAVRRAAGVALDATDTLLDGIERARVERQG